MKRLAIKIKIDYRHYICVAITLMSVAAGFLFPNGIPRLVESLRDLITSFLYYFFEIFTRNNNAVMPTVCKLQEWSFAPQIWKPITFLPSSFEEFFVFWGEYWKLVFNLDNFKSYYVLLADIIFYLSRFLLVAVPLVAVILSQLNSVKTKRCIERGLKSKPLKVFERFLFNVVYPVITWMKDFIGFCFQNGRYILIWFLLWGLYFNIFSLLIEFFAYYLYFTSSWEIFSIYTQLLKLQTDITPMVRFIPGLIWLVVGCKIFNHICKNMAYDRLHYAERCNEAVIRERGLVTIISGKMRKGKTQLATSMALIKQKVIYDDMDKVMLKYERYFPNFDWQIFRDHLDRLISDRVIVDLASCRKVLSTMCRMFDIVCTFFTVDEYREYLDSNALRFDRTFGYDFDHYAVTYNDNLRNIKLFRALEEYACAYYVFTVQTTLIFANYSIRDDSELRSEGNKPYRNNDFIHRDPELREITSRYAHILDQDMLRLQTKMIKDNEFARVLHPGAYVISEIDKERKNMLELKEMKINVDEANQKNDGFNSTLMMAGHANIVDYIPIIGFFADLQRPENLGAGALQLGEVVNIVDATDFSPALPFFSSYWFTEGVYQLVNSAWTSFKKEHDINRCDSTLFVYLIENIMSKIGNHYDKINGRFGMQTLTLEIQDGTLDGKVKLERWPLLAIRDRSERYSTDCLKGVFVTDPPNKKHIDDYLMYEGIMPTPKELSMQHSYFYNGIHKMKGKKNE